MTDTSEPAWIPSERFEEAVAYAIRAHATQARKGGTVPYLAHLFGVASLVMEDRGTEEETIAALLHDAAEDQGGEDRLRDIEERFGAQVAEIVHDCSEPFTSPRPPWPDRKASYLSHLPDASMSALRVALADKLHNARSMARDHVRSDGKDPWDKFNAPREAQAQYYRDLCEAFRDRDPSNPMLGELQLLVARVFGDSSGDPL